MIFIMGFNGWCCECQLRFPCLSLVYYRYLACLALDVSFFGVTGLLSLSWIGFRGFMVVLV